jgi:serine/threonine protein kinase
MHLHGLGIAHRDFRSANILVKAVNPLLLKVADFGVSSRQGFGVNGAGAGVGPLRWMAPECQRGGGVSDAKAADVYMFGGLMFEVMTGGVPPFFWIQDDDIAEYRRAHFGVSTLRAAEVDAVEVSWQSPPPTQSADALALMQRCLAASPGDRPSAADLVAELKRMMARCGGGRFGWASVDAPAVVERVVAY